MIPILFDGNSTEFNTNGLGRLSDCISCHVTEERNGVFEVEFVYPLTGIHYADIYLGKIIVVTHDDRKRRQPFVIYRRSAPISGQVVFNAHHISYNLSNVIIKPYTATTITAALAGFRSNAINDNLFTFWTDKTSSGTFTVEVPTACRALLAGQEGSVLDVFGGGDYEFDNYAVKLYANRGTDAGVTLRYGKNLIDLEAETDTMKLYTAVVPYWKNGDASVYGNIVYGNGAIRRSGYWTDENGAIMTDENGEPISFTYGEHKVVTMDLSSYFDDQPTVTQLNARALSVLNSNKPWVPTVNVKVDFAALWQTEEYKNIAPLQRVRLCDTVTVQYPELGVNVKARVVQTVWNPLLDRYDSIQIGDARTTFADTITAETDKKIADLPDKSFMADAIADATAQITGAKGGNIVFTMDANGDPTEFLIMDTKDKTTAVNVWRWNLGGLGHSHSGYNGPFDDVAITQDGKINANMITVGYLNANVIAANSISVSKLTGSIANGNWNIDLDNGTFTIGNISAVNITTGTLSADRIGPNSIGVSKMSGSITNNNWAIDFTNGTFTIGNISANNITTGTLSADRIAANSIAVSKLTGSITNGAWSIDLDAGTLTIGNISASKVTTGTMSAARISGGTLTLGGSSTNGKLEVYNSSDVLIGSFAKTGITINNGTIKTTDGTRTSVLESGYTKYYYSTSNTYIGDIGAVSANSEEGLMFNLKTDGDYMGWFLNGSSTPVLIYDKSSWLTKDIWEDSITVCRTLHVARGYTLDGTRIEDPSWKFSNTNYAGYTGTVTIDNVKFTFKKGVCTSVVNT